MIEVEQKPTTKTEINTQYNNNKIEIDSDEIYSIILPYLLAVAE